MNEKEFLKAIGVEPEHVSKITCHHCYKYDVSYPHCKDNCKHKGYLTITPAHREKLEELVLGLRKTYKIRQLTYSKMRGDSGLWRCRLWLFNNKYKDGKVVKIKRIEHEGYGKTRPKALYSLISQLVDEGVLIIRQAKEAIR